MRIRSTVAFSFVLGALAVACGDESPSVVRQCPGDLVRDDSGACVPPPEDTECDPSGLRIVEVLVDPEGAHEDGDQFVEIVGRSGHSLAGMALVVVQADGTVLGTTDLRGAADGQGLYVVGGANVDADETLAVPIPRNDGAVRLVDCDGAVVDAVAYGTFPDGSAFPGEGEPARAAPEGSSLARCVGAADTDDNRADFGVAAPSPGAPNPSTGFADPSFCLGEGDCVSGALTGRVRIEELLYNPDGTDAGNEFVELRADAGTVLDGVRIEGVNGSDGEPLFAPIVLAGTVGDDRVFVVGGDGVADADFPLGSITLQNGPDSIVLRDCDGAGVLDAVAWGAFDTGSSAGEGDPAEPASEGTALSRCGARDDTADNRTDFGAATPTPGRLALPGDFVDPAFCDDAVGPCVVGTIDARISEVLYDPEGVDGGLEFVELSGTAGTTLDGASLVFVDGADGEPYGSAVTLHGSFDDGGSFVVGGDQVAADQLLPFQIQNGPDSIVLFDCDGETRLDALGYGTFVEGDVSAGEGSAATTSGGGRSLARCGTAADTGDNATDFSPATPTPSASNGGFVDPFFCAAACTPGAFGDVRINEIVANPEGADGEAAAEFVELRGTPHRSAEGLWLAGIDGGDGDAYFGPVPLVGAFAADGYFVVGQANVAEASQTLEATLQNGPDSVVLYDCDGTTIVDAVGYGTGATVFAGEGTPAPTADGVAAARCEDAVDTGDNGADFGAATPTPGDANAGFDDALFCDATECSPVEPGAVTIDEVYFNPPGADGAGELEFVELRGTPGENLTGLTLTAINGTDGEPYLGPVGVAGTADGNGLFVLGGAGVSEADGALSGGLQNGPDSLVLRDCEGSTVDAVAYGTFAEDEFPAGEGAPAPSAADTSIGRTDGADTDDNATDFSVQSAPSPGVPN